MIHDSMSAAPPSITALDVITLAQTIYGEARGEPLDGQAAVAWVVVNRLNAERKSWGLTISQVCKKPKQFSCWNAGPPKGRLDLNNPAYLLALWVAVEVLAGRYTDMSRGASHYYAPGMIAQPRWAAKMRETAIIGGHRFLVEAA